MVRHANNFDGDISFTTVLNNAFQFFLDGHYLVAGFNIRAPMFIRNVITNAQLIQLCRIATLGALLLRFGPIDGSQRNVSVDTPAECTSGVPTVYQQSNGSVTAVYLIHCISGARRYQAPRLVSASWFHRVYRLEFEPLRALPATGSPCY